MKYALADPGFSFGRPGERRRREYRGAAGAEGVRFRRGLGRGLGRGLCPLPKFVLDFCLGMVHLRAF